MRDFHTFLLSENVQVTKADGMQPDQVRDIWARYFKSRGVPDVPAALDGVSSHIWLGMIPSEFRSVVPAAPVKAPGQLYHPPAAPSSEPHPMATVPTGGGFQGGMDAVEPYTDVRSQMVTNRFGRRVSSTSGVGNPNFYANLGRKT